MQRPTRSTPQALTAILLPVAVTLALYWYGRSHTPDYESGLFGLHYRDANGLKAQLGTALLGLALVQLLLALWIYHRLPGAGPAPRPVPTVHRIDGLLAFLLSLPIAYHCITAYGVRLTTTRVAVHSITGCVLYGAFVAKVLVVRSRRLPGWALPTAGGLLVAAIAVLWYTAALWNLDGRHVPGF
ncbi:DUF6529 family protein [Actinacidiphila oryziradicis]|jgi:hypothetical protein|uniref:Uncharacterized protein n=1 Tax=Actinacidiphila oryziradicis TaxID=2571141 RepID=A0A4U0SWW0_9ACTN|nr:DUF6529 family protein [Actinacidiphila oryziradicis]MCW2870761.1 hypothetical protein [Actinacidiphila oryziradicis]TKA12567.1 hypothetical protein FCI23_03990 [Actinacidiphila oryziradicis]